MRILTAIDSMKGSLTSIEANQMIEDVFSSSTIQVEKIAIGDGGEGTVEAFVENCQGSFVTVACHNLLGEAIQADFGWLADEKTAIIESASTCGIQFLDFTSATHPKRTSSAGLGEMMLAAAQQGAKRIIIGLGGTGTIDGGMGVLSSLGVEFFDSNGELLQAIGGNLGKVATFSLANFTDKLGDIEIVLASDVKSPIVGETGAVKMFGEQKGLLPVEMDDYEKNMKHYSEVLLQGKSSEEGDGAAGGLGLALRAVLKARMASGFELLAEYAQLTKKIEKADLVITGEGRIDAQSLQGKVPVGISQLAKKHQLPVIAFVGSMQGEAVTFKEAGLDIVIPLVDEIMTLEQAMADAKTNLQRVAERSKDLLFLLAETLG